MVVRTGHFAFSSPALPKPQPQESPGSSRIPLPLSLSSFVQEGKEGPWRAGICRG